MHIPAAETSTVEILPFQRALAGSGAADYDREKWLYVPDRYGEYRYLLGTRGARTLVCVGVNPSTAAPEDLDNTLKSVARVAAGNGFDSWVMCNVYAQRATRPDDMDRTLNPVLHRENMAAFAWLLERTARSGPPAVWAAWGAVIEKRPYLPGCVREMGEIGRRFGARWLKAGPCSKRGHPHHPLYLRRDVPVEAFDLETYLAGLS